MEKLKDNPNVKAIYPDRKIQLFLDDSAQLVNATNTWKLIYNNINITGKHETVCVLDTGVDYTHPALGGCTSDEFLSGTCSKVKGGYNFINGTNDASDDYGHGTHVAGIIASEDSTYRGIAVNASIVSVKVLNSAGSGSTADLISGIDWCVNNESKFNISVISMSLGVRNYKNTTYCDTSDNPLLVNSIHNAIGQNISVIVAAGNDDNSPLGVSTPACISNVTVVGSTTKTDSISSFSDLWGLPMLLAPGSSITSTQNGGGFVAQDGTSMSTPHVAAAFALIRQFVRIYNNSVLSPDSIQDVLNDTGKQIDDTANSGFYFSRDYSQATPCLFFNSLFFDL